MLEFHQALGYLSHAICSDPTRRNLQAVCVEPRYGKIVAVACDGFRLALAYISDQLALGVTEGVANITRAYAITATPDSAREASKAPIELTPDYLKARDTELGYPDWEQIVTRLESYPVKFVVGRVAFLNVLKELEAQIEKKRAEARGPLKAEIEALDKERGGLHMTARRLRAELIALKARQKAAKPPKPKTSAERDALRVWKLEAAKAVAAIDEEIATTAGKVKPLDKIIGEKRGQLRKMQKGLFFGLVLRWYAGGTVNLSWHDSTVGYGGVDLITTAQDFPDSARVGLNSVYLRQALTAISSKQITVGILDEATAVRLEHEHGFEVIMPMRI